jgi:hypothetical protein
MMLIERRRGLKRRRRYCLKKQRIFAQWANLQLLACLKSFRLVFFQ